MDSGPHDPYAHAPLVLMVGPPGAGKSTWAAGRFDVGDLFGLDMFRRMLGGDVLDQGATAAAAAMLATLLEYRMDTGRTTVVDATNASWDRRETLTSVAMLRRRPAVAVLMHTPLDVCKQRNRERTAAPWPGANDKVVQDETVLERMFLSIYRDPPTTDDLDLLVHVHPDDPAIAYAYPGKGRSVEWCELLLSSGRWGDGITLLTSRAALLPWPTPLNGRA